MDFPRSRVIFLIVFADQRRRNLLAQPGIGRAIMEYRARTIGAAILHGSADKGGFKVECIAPVLQISGTEHAHA